MASRYDGCPRGAYAPARAKAGVPRRAHLASNGDTRAFRTGALNCFVRWGKVGGHRLRRWTIATYKEIQGWVRQEHGFQPKTCWIAHCKELKGLPLGTAWNRAGDRQEPCPKERQPMIFAAFRRFGMTG